MGQRSGSRRRLQLVVVLLLGGLGRLPASAAPTAVSGAVGVLAVRPTNYLSIDCDSPRLGNLCVKVHCPTCGGSYGTVAGKKFSFTLTDSDLLTTFGRGHCTILDLNAFVELSQSQVGQLGAIGLERNGGGPEYLFTPSSGACGSSLDAIFDDEASTAANGCPADGAVLRSNDPLSSFDGERVDATWSVVINNNGPSNGSVSDFGFAADLACATTPSSSCTPSSTAACLNNGRFKVSATYKAPGQPLGQGKATGLTADTAWFWFFDSANVEAVVKVLNGCGVNGRYWVFASGLTDVNVVLTVEDTVAHTSKTYTNAQGTPFAPIQDTGAFATCP